ncbi:MAG: MoaD/ThiS family protein [Cytophagales bacterium]|nr:MoaD/ThiS family protein [Cytophagales bacterium]
MKKIKVRVFAVLKEYMDTEFDMEGDFSTIEEISQSLQQRFPRAIPVLRLSRFAVDQAFVDTSYILKNNDFIYIMPPSSGG